MDSSRIKRNVFVSIGGQCIVLLLGIFLPRILIVNYGSDTNGLISTISQIFTYMALLEAGIGQAARNALFKPIAEGDKVEISHIASIANNYYHRITLYYGIGVLILSIIAPLVLKSNVDNVTIFGIVIFEGLSGVVSFYFIQTETTILLADGKGYINNTISYIDKILSYAIRILLAFYGVNIVMLQFAYFAITIAKVFVYRIYFNKYYSWLNLHQATKKEQLKDKNSYVLTEIAWTLFSSTDMIVLSIFISTELSSVYGVYNLVFSNLNVLLNAVYSSVSYILGITFHRSIAEYEKVHDAFATIFMGTITVLMSVAYIMIFPFIRLYTDGVTDVEYIYQLLPLLFCLVQMLSWSRYVPGNLTGLAGYAKQTSIVSLVEALCNVTLSILLVNKYGIVGVLLATVIALPLKVIYCNYIADKKVMKRSFAHTIKILGTNFLLFFLVVEVTPYINLSVQGYLDFVVYCLVVFMVIFVAVFLANFFANPKAYKIIINYIRRR